MGPYDIEPLRGNIRCAFCALSPFYRWERRLTKADVSWALKKNRRASLWPVERLEVSERTMTGRLAKIRIRGKRHYVTLSGYDFRSLFGFDGIRSTAFSIVPDGDGFVLQGRGWGHGVGLCQWGAAELARRGLSAKEMLAFYYPDTRVVRLDEVQSSINTEIRKGGP
jgi:stage II sporulation protein D